MSYIEDQHQKVPDSDRVTFFSPPVTIAGGGIFKKAEREFVLKDASLNIWADVREDAISYFNRCGIPSGNQPTGQPDIKSELPTVSTLPTASTKNANPKLLGLIHHHHISTSKFPRIFLS